MYSAILIDGTCLISQTPLCAAAHNGDAALLEILLKAGADVNKVSHWMWEYCYRINQMYRNL